MTYQPKLSNAMPGQDSSLKSFDDQVKSSKANLADLIKSAAEKDTRMKPWQSTRKDGPATFQEGDQDRGATLNGKDEYWMAEGSVNASS